MSSEPETRLVLVLDPVRWVSYTLSQFWIEPGVWRDGFAGVERPWPDVLPDMERPATVE